MKVKMTRYCEEVIENKIVTLDHGRVFDLNDNDAMKLITKGLATEVNEMTGPSIEPVISVEDKMIHLVKKRGRPRKED